MTQRHIPFFNYPSLFQQKEKEFLSIIQDVCQRGAYILQKDLEEFENNLKTFLNVKHVFGVADGTNALMIGLHAIGLQAEDEVIMPSHTYIASAASVQLLGGKPILVEIGSDHMLDPDSVKKAITAKTKVIMPVQVNGRTCNMEALQKIANEHNLIIVEDAAQGLGSRFKGRFAGTFGAFGTFSFYPAKLLGCFGDGGAIVTNDDDIADFIYRFRDHGRNKEGKVVSWGTNSRLDNLQAAILNFKLKSYEQDLQRRRTIARQYHEAFKEIKELKLPPPPSETSSHYDVFQNYELYSEQRDALRQYLKEKGVHTIIQWSGIPVHLFKELGFNQSLPVTETFFKGCFMLPMHTALSQEDVEYIIEQICAFYDGGTA